MAVVTSLLTPEGMWWGLRLTSLCSTAVVLVAWMFCLILHAQGDRLTRGGVLLTVLIGLSLVFYFVPLETVRRWRDRLPLTGDKQLWLTALSITLCFGILGLVYIEFLFLIQSPIAKSHLYSYWQYFDKRYVVAFYLLGIGLTYLPGFLVRVLTRLSRAGTVQSFSSVAPGPVEFRQWSATSVSLWLSRAIAATLIGAVLAILYVGPPLSSVVTSHRPIDFHEGTHLGALQRIAQGAVPYVEARSMYGPGLQMLTYQLMQATEFTAQGFRLSFARINAVATDLLFATTLFAFGWGTGLLAIGISQFVSPLPMADFVGWAYFFRWMGPFVTGALLPMLIWRPVPDKFRYAAILILGMVCGALAWYAQENLSFTIFTAALILLAGVIRERASVRQLAILFLLFVSVQGVVFMLLFGHTVGFANLQRGLTLYFRGSHLIASGVANTDWWEPLRPLGIAYYLTPYVVIAITLLALYSRGRDDSKEHKRGALIGMAAAAAALTTITLFRSDSSHFLGSSAAIAPLLALSVVYLPGLLSTQLVQREAIRVALIATFLLIYPLPRSPGALLAALTPHVSAAMDAVRVLQQGSPDSQPGTLSGANLLDRRLGFSLGPDARCCINLDWTSSEVGKLVEEVHRAADGRTVLVDDIPGTYPSFLYFFADLRVGTSFTEPSHSLWVDQDMEELRAELRAHPPECVVTSSPNLPQTRLVFPEQGHYTEVKLPTKMDVFVLCRN